MATMQQVEIQWTGSDSARAAVTPTAVEAQPQINHKECDLNDTDHPVCGKAPEFPVTCLLCQGHAGRHVNGLLAWE